MTFIVDAEKVTEAIVGTGAPALALEEGAGLAQAWIEDEHRFQDEILAVEAGWSVRLDENTWAVGVMDLVCKDAQGVYGREHKTTAAPTRYWNEGKWLESIKTGPQIGVYALALARGAFYLNRPDHTIEQYYDVKMPVRIRVRAAVKTAVPMFWPEEEKDGWKEYNEDALTAIANGFRAKAAAIRAVKAGGLTPWQLTGSHCVAYNRQCEYFDECSRYQKPVRSDGVFDAGDPAADLALPYLPEEAREPDAVILSASAYTTYSRCMELGRRNAEGGGKEESMALAVGSVFHAGVAAYYSQLREYQNNSLTVPISLDTPLSV